LAHNDYFKKAIKLALRAKGKVSPNPLVGAIIVKNNRVVAQGWHKHCGSDHAEIAALKKAGSLARGAVIYVTLEPCSHYGRTPPCVDAIIKSGIKKVFIGMKDPNPLTKGKSIAKFRKAGIKTEIGFLEDDLKGINEPFIKFMTKKMPFVTAKCAQTIDGKIAAYSGRSKWITSKESREYARKLRNDFDAILVGSNTVLKDNPGLNASRKSKRLKKIIIDSALKTPLNAGIFRGTDPSDIIIAATKKSRKEKRGKLEKRGIYLVICPTQKGQVDLKWFLKKLAERDITNILIEGGSKIIGSALRQKLIDKFLIFIAPKIIGDQNALSSVSGLNIRDVNKAVRLHKITINQLKDDILIEAYVFGNS
jgi:diaminohydroxyphosphoribosylaminopyrimidine deaminase/5-amino-6-(5-phosphoribosylamino)uracil reductase